MKSIEGRKSIKMDNIMLSIYVTTYNHENYIKQALDSIFSQVTEYSYEVLVGEDCSTDNTRQVLKQYEIEHPDYVAMNKLKIFYRDHNMYKECPSNSFDLKMRCKGKYVIALEGDDYWIDCSKIQRQIDFLEKNSDYIAVAHNCIVVDENGEKKFENYPECKDSVYITQHYMKGILPGQLATVMYRNIYHSNTIDLSIFNKGLIPGDRILYLVLLMNGKVYCMQEAMSAYRHITSHGSSFSATFKYDFAYEELWNRELLLYIKAGYYSYLSIGEDLYTRCILRGIKGGQCSIKEALEYSKNLDHRVKSLFRCVIYKIKKILVFKDNIR